MLLIIDAISKPRLEYKKHLVRNAILIIALMNTQLPLLYIVCANVVLQGCIVSTFYAEWENDIVRNVHFNFSFFSFLKTMRNTKQNDETKGKPE